MRVKQDIKFKSDSSRGVTAGFSVIELLVVIAIAGIIFALAVPNYTSFMNREKVTTLSEEFASSLFTVRSIAIKSGVPVLLCASSDNESCGGQWGEGWLAFRDDNRDAVLGTEDTIVLRRNNDSSTTDISVTSLTGDDVSTVSFNYRGAPDSALSVAVTSGAQNHSMTVTPFGKTRHHD